MAKTPPRGLPDIPGVTSPPVKDKAQNGEPLNNNVIKTPDSKAAGKCYRTQLMTMVCLFKYAAMDTRQVIRRTSWFG